MTVRPSPEDPLRPLWETMHMRTIAIVNQKGGCGKTTTAINLAAVYASRGVRTMLIDMDPQSHCAAGLGVPERSLECTIADALMATNDNPFDPDRLLWPVGRHLALAPSTTRLAALEAPEGGLHRRPDKDRRLQAVVEELDDRFDCCLIDCPPTIGLLTFNALRAAREVLIPVETAYFSLKGAQKQWQTIQVVIEKIGRPIACHLLPTLHRPDQDVSVDILRAMRRQFAGQILPIEIGEHPELREAASLGQPITEFAPGSTAHQDYEALADWLDEHRRRPVAEIEILGRDADPDRNTRTPGGDAAARLTAAGRAAELADRLRKLSDRHSDSSPSTNPKPMPTAIPEPTRRRPVHVSPPSSVPPASAPAAPASAPTAPAAVQPVAPMSAPPTSRPVSPSVASPVLSVRPSVGPSVSRDRAISAGRDHSSPSRGVTCRVRTQRPGARCNARSGPARRPRAADAPLRRAHDQPGRALRATDDRCETHRGCRQLQRLATDAARAGHRSRRRSCHHSRSRGSPSVPPRRRRAVGSRPL